jgi:branched-chain amino acid transport system substrate-binding protein
MPARLWVAVICAIAGGLALPARAAEPTTIDVVLPLSGPAAFLGNSEQRALQRFEATEGQAAGIRFAFHDDQSNPQTAVQLATEIVARKPPIVIGSAVVAMCNAMAPLMRRGPVMYCLSPGIYPAAGSFVFSSSNATKDLAAVLVRYYRLRGLTRLGVITSTDASGLDAARNIKDVLAQPENKDMQLVADASFNPTDVSASAQIQRIKGANPQAMIAWSTGAAVGTVFKAIKDAGLAIPVATTDANMTYAAMRQFADILPAELDIPSPEWPKTSRTEVPPAVAAAKQHFFAAFPESDPPDAASTYAWDPALLVAAALAKAGPGATAEQIRAAIDGMNGFAGVNGIYDFRRVPQRGLDDSNVVMTRWDAAAKQWTIVSEPRGVPLK